MWEYFVIRFIAERNQWIKQVDPGAEFFWGALEDACNQLASAGWEPFLCTSTAEVIFRRAKADE